MFQFNIQRRAGFECGTTGARMVTLVRRNGGLLVEHVFLEEILFESRMKGSARSRIDVSRQLLLHRKFSGCKTVLAAPGAVESCFVILPRMGRAETEGAVRLQAGKLVSWEEENPLVSFVSSEFLRDRAGHLVGLADWTRIKAWGRLFEAGGALVDDVTVAASAFLSIARRQEWASEFPVFLVANIGAADSWFYVMDGHSVRFMRKAPVGGDAITKTLTTVVSIEDGSIELTDLEAEDVKITGWLPAAKVEAIKGRGAGHAAPPDAVEGTPKRLKQMEALVRPVVERIASEITRSMQFFKDNAGQKVDAVFLTGGASQLPALRSHIEASAGVPVRVIDPFAGFSFVSASVKNYAEKNAARLTIAMGLALSEKPAISLLPRHVHLIKKIAGFMPKAVAALLIFGFLPIMALGIFKSVQIRLLHGRIEEYQPRLKEVAQEQGRLVALQTQCAEQTAYVQALRELVGRNPLWPGVLNALADAVPKDVVLIRFGAGVDPENQDVILIGGKVLPSAERFDDAMSSFLSALGSSPFFRRVSIINARAAQSVSELGTFEIRCELLY